MASDIITTITRYDVLDLEYPKAAVIKAVKHITSYNWIEEENPTISVPGSPALWSPLKMPHKVYKDSGTVYIDQNRARHPDYPLEPIFRALVLTESDFDINSIDVVADQNIIQTLLDFINPPSSQRGIDSFTINIETAGNSVLLSLNGPASRDIQPGDPRVFGRNFVQKFTTEQVTPSSGHHRIITYKFGGLRLLICHDTSVYRDTSGYGSASVNPTIGTNDELGDIFDQFLAEEDDNNHTKVHESKLKVIKKGQVVQKWQTVEVKTGVSHTPLLITQFVSQLWISQTPHLIRAYHKKGVFESAEIDEVQPRVKVWEEANQEFLKRLAALMNRIVEGARKHGGSAVLEYDSASDVLIIRKAENAKMLPEDLYSKWKGGNENTHKGRSILADDSKLVSS